MAMMLKRLWPLHINAAMLLLGMLALGQHDQVRWYSALGAILLLAVLYVLQWYLEREASQSAAIFYPIAFLLTLSWLVLLRLNEVFALKQLVWIVSGAIALAIVTWIIHRISKEQVLKGQYLWWVMTVILLVLPLLIGVERGGARSWLYIGPISVQPSELAKITFLLFIVSWYKNAKEHNLKNIVVLLCGVLIVLGILVAQVDLGAALIFYSIFIIMMYLSTGKRSWAVIGLGVLLIGGLFAYLCFGHVRVRVHTWYDPWSDPQYGGYQLIRSLSAFAAGKWFGTGLGAGEPYMIPAAHTDFIFAVVGEQFGYIGCLLCMGAYLAFITLVCKRIVGITTKGSFLVASGLGFFFIAQSFIIIGGVIKFVPLTGVTLPFLSYGGSSLVSSMAALGVIIGICQKREATVPIQYRKVQRIKWVVWLIAVMMMLHLFYWQIIKGAEIIEKMMNLV